MRTRSRTATPPGWPGCAGSGKQYDGAVADRFRATSSRATARRRGRAVRFAEAFEVSEYGRPLPPDEIARWFPL